MGDIYFIVTNMTLCYVVPLFIIVSVEFLGNGL